MSTGSSTSCDSKLIEETKSGPCTFLPASVFFLSWLQLSTRLAFLSRLNTGCLSVKHAHSGFLTDCNDLLTLQAHHISAGIHPLCIYICCIFSSPHCFRRPLTLEFLIPHTHTNTLYCTRCPPFFVLDQPGARLFLSCAFVHIPFLFSLLLCC